MNSKLTMVTTEHFFLKMGYLHCKIVFERAPNKDPWSGSNPNRIPPVLNKQQTYYFGFIQHTLVYFLPLDGVPDIITYGKTVILESDKYTTKFGKWTNQGGE